MADTDSTDQLALLAELARRGVASSVQLQHVLGKSPPTLSRLLARLAQQQLALGQPPLVVLGRQRSARHALAQPLLGLPGQQALTCTDETGQRQPWGQLTHLGQDRLHLQAGALLQFGRLIGNSDMHFGNRTLVVANPTDAARGRFSLAPVYDMLPMRWRPDVQSGGLDWLPSTPQPSDLASAARPVALQFWQQAQDLPTAPRAFRQLPSTMAQRLADAA